MGIFDMGHCIMYGCHWSGVKRDVNSVRRIITMSELDFREADKLEVTVLVDNYTDLVLLQSTDLIKRPPLKPSSTPLAEHGLSFLVKVFKGPEEHVVLMDAGISTTCLLHNADVLGIDLMRVESVVLSHGHFDHFGGLVGFLNEAKRGIPLILHPDAFLQRRINSPDIGHPVDTPGLNEKQLKETGVKIYKSEHASTVASGLILVLGEVERVTDFEKGLPWAEAKIDETWVVDPFHDDQGVAVNVHGRGLVVFGGCSHAGIINTVKHARKVAKIDKVHAVLGGFHLSGQLFEPIIGPTIEEMKKIGPDIVVPMHCTGWRAINQFAEAMPRQFILNTVGTTYIFQ
jgi:7,8-dihydropterin-6-yl-methyl-4-(beta-D-ribofuranosyl)aminobenzene 5'-phosphate synthase